MGQWTRDELERAHEHYKATAAQAAASGDWRAWADMFTEDAEYVEHVFGEFHGREAIYEWISATMSKFPNNHMTSFPHDWCVCDEERGWWICQIENRFDDPGDGQVYEASNVTILHYAGNDQWSREEDVYNPAAFAPVVEAYLKARKAHSG